jgi:CTP:molybdopterin cytidylyltransferase MocA
VSRVAGLVLAAGGGRRFGRPKAVVELEGERLVDRAVRALAEGGCAPVVVVSGAVPLEVPGAIVVDNPKWQTGMGSSLRVGVGALPEDAVAVVLALVDTPWVGPGSVRRLIRAHGDGAGVAVATYGGVRGRPVLLGRSQWAAALASAHGDRGAREFLAARPDLVVEVPCDGTGDPRDVDRLEDLSAG